MRVCHYFLPPCLFLNYNENNKLRIYLRVVRRLTFLSPEQNWRSVFEEPALAAQYQLEGVFVL